MAMSHYWAVKYIGGGLYRFVRYPIPQLIERRRTP